jgi:hypothetical protein
MRISGRYLRIGGVWYLRAGYIGATGVVYPAGRRPGEVVGVYPPDTGTYTYALEADVEEEVHVESRVRYADIWWRLQTLWSGPTRPPRTDPVDFEAGRITRPVAPDEPGVYAQFWDLEGRSQNYADAPRAVVESAWSNWPGSIWVKTELANITGYEETVTPWKPAAA